MPPHVFSYAVTTIFEQIISMDTPVIAAIRGIVTGGGPSPCHFL